MQFSHLCKSDMYFHFIDMRCCVMGNMNDMMWLTNYGSLL